MRLISCADHNFKKLVSPFFSTKHTLQNEKSKPANLARVTLAATIALAGTAILAVSLHRWLNAESITLEGTSGALQSNFSVPENPFPSAEEIEFSLDSSTIAKKCMGQRDQDCQGIFKTMLRESIQSENLPQMRFLREVISISSSRKDLELERSWIAEACAEKASPSCIEIRAVTRLAERQIWWKEYGPTLSLARICADKNNPGCNELLERDRQYACVLRRDGRCWTGTWNEKDYKTIGPALEFAYTCLGKEDPVCQKAVTDTFAIFLKNDSDRATGLAKMCAGKEDPACQTILGQWLSTNLRKIPVVKACIGKTTPSCQTLVKEGFTALIDVENEGLSIAKDCIGKEDLTCQVLVADASRAFIEKGIPHKATDFFKECVGKDDISCQKVTKDMFDRLYIENSTWTPWTDNFKDYEVNLAIEHCIKKEDLACQTGIQKIYDQFLKKNNDQAYLLARVCIGTKNPICQKIIETTFNKLNFDYAPWLIDRREKVASETRDQTLERLMLNSSDAELSKGDVWNKNFVRACMKEKDPACQKMVNTVYERFIKKFPTPIESNWWPRFF